jgi:hypothetical protein
VLSRRAPRAQILFRRFAHSIRAFSSVSALAKRCQRTSEAIGQYGGEGVRADVVSCHRECRVALRQMHRRLTLSDGSRRLNPAARTRLR